MKKNGRLGTPARQEKLNMKKRGLKVLVTLLVALSCSAVFAEEEFSPTLTANAKIQLDPSKVDHPILDILNSNIQSPSEYMKKQKKAPIVQKPIKTEPSNPLSNLPNDKINKTNGSKLPQSFDEIPILDNYTSKGVEMGRIKPDDLNTPENAFAPPIDALEEKEPEIQTPPQVISTEKTEDAIQSPIYDSAPPTEVLVETEETYTTKAEEPALPEVDYNGKTIGEINFIGLNLIGKDVIYSQIKAREGSIYNLERLQEDLQNIYATGYFSDNISIEPELKDNGTVSLTFTLEENLPVNDLSIVGNTVFSSAELLPLVNPLKGLPQNVNLINESIEKINNYYHDKGYILAAVSDVSDDSSGNLNFTITEGVIEKIVFDGNKKTKDYVIQRNIMTQAGSIYNEELFKKDLAKVYETQIFEEVDRKIEPSTDKEGEYIVTVKVKEGSQNSMSVGGGLDNALGVFGSIGYNEKNLFGRGQKLSVSGMIGSGIIMSDASIKNRMNYNAELNFFEPYFINADNSLSAKAYYRDLGSYQIPLAIERRFGAGAEVRHKVKGYNNLTTFYGAGFEHISLKEGDFNKIAKQYAKSHINIAKRDEQLTGGLFFNLSGGAKYSTLDNENMPRDGFIAQARYTEALGLDNFKKTNGRLLGSATQYIPLFEKSSLSIGARAGIKVHGDHMPEVMAFRLGGPYTVRGFRMNGVGTGDSFLMGTAELLTPIPLMDKFKYEILKNLRFAFFVDAGKIFDPTISSKLYDRPLSAISAGVGVRIYIPGMGPIAIDYGIPLTNPGHYGHKGGCFTFGTGGIYDNY